MNLDDNSAPNVTTPTATPESTTTTQRTAHTPVAWWLHTVVLVVFLLGVSFLGSRGPHGHGRGHIQYYVFTMAMEWAMVGYILLGIRKRRLRLRDLIRGRWHTGVNVLRDSGIALGFWGVSLVVLSAVGKLLGLGGAGALADAKEKFGPLIPSNGIELLVFFFVSITAGFCEELIFRGYLQRQFAALTRSEGIAIALQAMVFGLGHGYQGAARMVVITVYGAMFGLLALWRKSLRPGMISHAWQDAFSGVAMYVAFVVFKR